MADLSILIVCYKSKGLIEACLRGVYEHTRGVDFEVLLLDCSGDGTIELVREQFPQVRIIDNAENLGFAKGNNELARHALGRYLLLLNPDTIIENDAIGALYRTARKWPRAGAIGGWCKLPDGSRDSGCRQFLPTVRRLFVVMIGGAKLLNGAIAETATEAAEVETLSGAFMLVRADAWREAGGFDESFFMYSEEMDLCYRLRRAGHQIVMTPEAEIIHLGGGGDSGNPRRNLMFTTGRMHFIRKHRSRPVATVAAGMIWCQGAVRWAAGATGARLGGGDRFGKLRDRYAGIALKPGDWWRGYAE